MHKTILLLGLAVGALLAGHAQAGTIKEYTAEMVNVDSGQVEQKFYVTEQKIRTDMLGSRNTAEGVIIMRLDRGKLFMLQPEDQAYFEVPLDKNVKNLKDLENQTVLGMSPEVKREKLGNETVNGYKTEKFKVTTSATVANTTNTTEHYEWVAPEFDLPLRLQTPGDKAVLEMRNIKIGAPAASVFEIPYGYRPILQNK